MFTKLLRLRPVLAFLVVNSGFAISTAMRGLGTSEVSSITASFIAALVLVGWSAMIVDRLSRTFEAVGHPARVWLAFLCTLAAHVILFPILTNSSADSWYWGAMAAVTWSLGFFGPLYVIWSASSLLVTIEERRPASIDRSIGTFLMLFFLPVGVLFVQKRVRRLMSGSSGGNLTATSTTTTTKPSDSTPVSY